jgi:nucleoside-diphosphate-sugar epimerase
VTRVLVTGGTGFIGRHSVAALERAGHEVHVASSSGRGVAGSDPRIHHADLLDATQATRLLDAVRPAHLLHLAWDVTPGSYLTSDSNRAWTAASLHLLREFARHGERAVMAGTCFEYDHSGGVCDELETPLRPVSLYGTCKDAVRAASAELARESGLSLAWGRIFHLYGPAEHPTRLVASVTRALLHGEPAAVTHGRQVRDYLHSADVGEAFAALLGSGLEGPVNVGSGEGVTLAELVAEVGRAAGRPELIRLGARVAPEGEPPRIVAALGRLHDEVGWRPARPLAEGIAATVDWWRGDLQARPTPARSDSTM